MNKMQDIRIEKITVNVGCGEAGQKLDRAKTMLEIITGKKVVLTRTKRRTTFGVPKHRQIGCKAILRGNDAEAFLKNAFEAVENKLSLKCFDKNGNFSFGIKEQIDLPGVKYDPDIGIYGFDVCVTLERPGFRVKRKRMGSKIGKNHVIKPDESKDWVIKKFNINVENIEKSEEYE